MGRRSIREINKTKYILHRKLMDIIKPYILILPSFLLLVLCIFGILCCALQAMGIMSVVGLKSLTFDYIKQVLFSKKFINSFVYTLYLSFFQSMLSIIFGFIISVYLIKNKITKFGLLYIPFAVPHIVVAMFTILLFAENGFISRLICSLNIINNMSAFPNILYNDLGFGTIIAYVWKGVAYVLSVVYVVIRVCDTKYYEVIKGMKVSYIRYVIDILLPLSKKQLISSFLILFSFSFGSYELPFLLNKTTHKTLAVYAYEEFLNPNMLNRPVAQSYNLIMALCGLIIILLYIKTINNKIK